MWDPWIKRWLFTYLNEDTAQIELREAENPWGPWSVPIALATAHQFPQLYGAFMTPSFLRDSGKFVVFRDVNVRSLPSVLDESRAADLSIGRSY